MRCVMMAPIWKTFALFSVCLLMASVLGGPAYGKEDMIIGTNLVEGDPGDGHNFSGGGGGGIPTGDDDSQTSGQYLGGFQREQFEIPVFFAIGESYLLFIPVDWETFNCFDIGRTEGSRN